MITGLFLATGCLISVVHAAETSEDLCKRAIHNELAKEQRLYRAVLFGEPSDKGATLGKVKFDKDGDPWIKTKSEVDGTNWASLSGKGDGEEKKSHSEAADIFGINENAAKQAPAGTTLADEDGTLWIKIYIPEEGTNEWVKAMSNQTDEDMKFNEKEASGPSAELQAQRGIFDTQRTLTSELIPFLVSSMRTFQCRLQYACGTVNASINTNDAQSVTLEIPGCISEERPLVPTCRFAVEEKQESEAANMKQYCSTIGDELLKREADLLKFAVEYDAAYRTILQFAGTFDVSLQELKWPLSFTIRQATGIIGQYSRIPCFLGNCDASPIAND